jgi:hypothetical protein
MAAIDPIVGELPTEAPPAQTFFTFEGADGHVLSVRDVRQSPALVVLSSSRQTHACVGTSRYWTGQTESVLCGQLGILLMGQETSAAMPSCPRCAAQLRLRYPEVVAQIEGAQS